MSWAFMTLLGEQSIFGDWQFATAVRGSMWRSVIDVQIRTLNWAKRETREQPTVIQIPSHTVSFRDRGGSLACAQYITIS